MVAAQGAGSGGAQSGSQAGSSSGATAGTSGIGDQRSDGQAGTVPPRHDRHSGRQQSNDLQQFVEKATVANMAEIQLGQLAVKQAQDPQVKQFAQMMVDEHTKALEQLRTAASSQGLQVASALDSKHQKLQRQALEASGCRVRSRLHGCDGRRAQGRGEAAEAAVRASPRQGPT